MPDFGLFEAATDADQAPRRKQRIAARQMSAALSEVVGTLGPYVANATTPEYFEDRWGHVRKDASKIMIAHGIGSYPAVMREVYGSLRNAWQARHAAKGSGPVHPGEDASPEELAAHNRAMDKYYDTSPDSPLHSDNRRASLADAPIQDIQETFRPSESDLVPEGNFDRYLDEVDQGGPEAVRSNDFSDGGDSGVDGHHHEARQLVADLYLDWAQGNRLRHASMDTLDVYASNGLHDNDYYLLAGLIRRAECDCDDDKDTDGPEGPDKDTDGPPSHSSEDSDDDSDDSSDESSESGSDSDGDSDDSSSDESSSGDNPFAGSDDSGDDGDSDDGSDFGGEEAGPPAADDGGNPFGDDGGEDLAAAGPPEAGPPGDVGGQSFEVPDQAPELPPEEMDQLGGDPNPQQVPPEVIDDILGLPPGTIEALITEEIQGAQGGSPPPGGPPPQLASRRRAAEDPTQAAEPAAPGGPAAAPAQMPAAPPAGAGSAGTMPPPGSASVPAPPPAMPLENQPAEDALLDTALQSVTQMIDQETQEYQQIIDPLTQALQAIEFAQQVETAENPLDVTPPEGSVDVSPAAAPGGADSMQQQAARRRRADSGAVGVGAAGLGIGATGEQAGVSGMDLGGMYNSTMGAGATDGGGADNIGNMMGASGGPGSPTTPGSGLGAVSESIPAGNASGSSFTAYRIARRYNLSETGYGMLCEAMSRKHYEHVGEAIRTLPPELRPGIADHIGKMFGEDNSRFNHDKWLASVGVTASRRPFVIRSRTAGGGRDWMQDEHQRDAEWRDANPEKAAEKDEWDGHESARRTAGETSKSTPTMDAFEFPGTSPKGKGVTPQVEDPYSVNDLPKMKGAGLDREAKGVLDMFDDFTKKRTDTGLNLGDAANVDAFTQEKGPSVGPKALDKLKKTITTGRQQASFFTRRVPGWQWDDHLAGYVSKEARNFTCSCGNEIPTPSYGNCRCGKLWNSYAIGDGNHLAANSADMYITREIPIRDDVIMANRKMAGDDRGYGVGDTEWVTDEDRENADAPHAPGQTASFRQACWPGCHEDEAHAKKFHSDSEESTEKSARVNLALDAAHYAGSQLTGTPVTRNDDPSFQGTVTGVDPARGTAWVQHPGGHHEMNLHDLATSGAPAPQGPTLKDKVRNHVQQFIQNRPTNGGFAGGRSANAFFASWADEDSDGWTKYDSPDPARSGGPSKPPSTKLKGNDPKWHSRAPEGKFKSTSPFKA